MGLQTCTFPGLSCSPEEGLYGTYQLYHVYSWLTDMYNQSLRVAGPRALGVRTYQVDHGIAKIGGSSEPLEPHLVTGLCCSICLVWIKKRL